MMALQSKEEHNITQKTWPYLGLNSAIPTVPIKLRDLRCKCDRIFDSIEELNVIEIRSHDSIIIPLMIEENRTRFFTVSLRVPLEQGLP